MCALAACVVVWLYVISRKMFELSELHFVELLGCR